MTEAVEAITRTVLYEGYLLWPYRRSAKKNRQRWTFGGCYPRAFSETSGTNDPWWRQTECVVAGAAPVATVRVRFLHVVSRELYRGTSQSDLIPVQELSVGVERYLSWEEATERSWTIDRIRLAGEEGVRRIPFSIPEGSNEEPLRGPDGTQVGLLIRRWKQLDGLVEIETTRSQDQSFRLRVRVSNLTSWNGDNREATKRLAFLSTHAVLTVTDGRFLSLLDPPETYAPAVAQCENIGTWPVLVGEPGSHNVMLSSPIILYDHPRIAPESPGDLFDGTEIDQLLTLSILAMTDEEKAEMRATDPLAREILRRTEALTDQELRHLHGAIRPAEAWTELEQPVPRRIEAGGSTITKGSRVRLRPRPGGDSWDVILAGLTGRVESIEQDYEDRVYLAVSLDNDPGRDLAGMSSGHRFYFFPEEVDVIDPVPDDDVCRRELLRTEGDSP